MATPTRAAVENRIRNLKGARARSDAKFEEMIARATAHLDALPELDDPPPTRPFVSLPTPSTPPEAPSIEEAPALARYVPTAEVLALTDAADVLTALGKLETPREEHELVSAWTVAGNRAALNAVAVHVGGPLADRAARALKRITPETQPAEA